MMDLEDSVVGVWYVNYRLPVDVVCVLRQFDDHYELSFLVREHGADNNPTNVREHSCRRAPIPLSEAIRYVRSYFKELAETHKVLQEWEALRGARSTEEYAELIMSMPNAFAREATAEEVEAFQQRQAHGADHG